MLKIPVVPRMSHWKAVRQTQLRRKTLILLGNNVSYVYNVVILVWQLIICLCYLIMYIEAMLA